MPRPWSSLPPIEPFAASERGFSLSDFVAFLIPSLIFLEINLGGRLFLSEVLLLSILPLLALQKGRALLRRDAVAFFAMCFVWLLAQILTDMVRDTPVADWTRGWSKIVFFGINTAAFSLLLEGRDKRAISIAWGVVAGQLLKFGLNPNEFALSYPWKFGYGYSVTLAAVLVSQRVEVRRIGFLAEAVLAVAGLANLILDFRSLAAICFITAAYSLAMRTFTSRRAVPRRLSTPRVVVLGLAGVISIVAFSKIYSYAANAGYLSEAAQQKYQDQVSGDFGVLLGARREILASSQAIFDSPIIGHGSWAKDPKYSALLSDRLAELGYANTYVDSDLIPSHSFLLGAWVEAGIVGAAFWVWCFSLVLRVVVRSAGSKHPLTPLVVFLGFAMLWDILFSPFGAEHRVFSAFVIAFMMQAKHSLAIAKVAQKNDLILARRDETLNAKKTGLLAARQPSSPKTFLDMRRR